MQWLPNRPQWANICTHARNEFFMARRAGLRAVLRRQSVPDDGAADRA
jgi:hypothetical protein